MSDEEKIEPGQESVPDGCPCGHPLGGCLEFGHEEQRQALAVEATAHFLAALVATSAASQHPESVAWSKVIDP